MRCSPRYAAWQIGLSGQMAPPAERALRAQDSMVSAAHVLAERQSEHHCESALRTGNEDPLHRVAQCAGVYAQPRASHMRCLVLACPTFVTLGAASRCLLNIESDLVMCPVRVHAHRAGACGSDHHHALGRRTAEQSRGRSRAQPAALHLHHPLRACCVAAGLRGEWVGEAAALVSELGIDLGDASASMVRSRALLSSAGLAVAVGSVGRAERIVCMCHAYACVM
jgi:hypothetical protein